MAERHGIERLRWLKEPWDWPDWPADRPKPEVVMPRHAMLDEKQVSVECSLALIEELHDAMRFLGSLAAPVAIIRGADPP